MLPQAVRMRGAAALSQHAARVGGINMARSRATVVAAAANASSASSRVSANVMWRQHRDFATKPRIVYTKTDEAPALATYSLLPIIKRFTDPAGIEITLSDISVAARVLAAFPERLAEDQRVPDALADLGKLAVTKEANIIKLPNVSASVPQLQVCIRELQAKGYDVPDYPLGDKAKMTPEQLNVLKKYEGVIGSAVNPVLRQGNSDRRAALPVKADAQKNPIKLGAWSADSRTHVAHMTKGDFFATEQATTFDKPATLSIQFEGSNGTKKALREGVKIIPGELVDASVMHVAALRDYLSKEIDDAHQKDVLLSLHLKATMMKVSDPIMFGHAVKVFYKSVFDKHRATFERIGANPNNGIGDIYNKIGVLPDEERRAIEADIDACYAKRPRVAMVDSRKGITNLHVPSDVIIDASMPVVVRDSGKMWNKDDKLEDVKCLIPDRSYARVYQSVFDFMKKHGAFDPATMGHVPNVGLMAQKAQEYGSHPSTFEIPSEGKVLVKDETGKTIFEHPVFEGDIWRMCQVKDAPIKDWVKLAVTRARLSETPAIFWLDPERAHDRELIKKSKAYLKDHDTKGLDITFAAPHLAAITTMERAKEGKDTISVTGNVLRDYLTDLFPILELGTSAKMLSIVPLLEGGALFETGAGGSAPKHVQQFVEEGHLRWDSLGEYMAMSESLAHLAHQTGNKKAKLLGDALLEAVGHVLNNRKSPSRKVKELDNRGTNFYIAKYWAEAMAKHDPHFEKMAKALADNEDKILKELADAQGKPVDIGGYYKPEDSKAGSAMRPSPTLNSILDM